MALDILKELIKAVAIIDECLIKWGCPQLRSQITVDFNNRFKSRAGDATWKNGSQKGAIRLSSPLWSHMSPEDQRNTIVHEAAHIVQYYQYHEARRSNFLAHRYVPKPKPHGVEWKVLMKQMGEAPERTHDIDSCALGISKKRQRYQAICKCTTHVFGPIVAKRMKTNKIYYCRLCKEPIRAETLKEVI